MKSIIHHRKWQPAALALLVVASANSSILDARPPWFPSPKKILSRVEHEVKSNVVQIARIVDDESPSSKPQKRKASVSKKKSSTKTQPIFASKPEEDRLVQPATEPSQVTAQQDAPEQVSTVTPSVEPLATISPESQSGESAFPTDLVTETKESSLASQPKTEQQTDDDKAAKPSERFATPVPGQPGFVFPPGTAWTLGNKLDVRGLSPGQKARDPRTGAIFLVP